MTTVNIKLLCSAALLASASVAANSVDERRDVSPGGSIDFETIAGTITIVGHDADYFRLSGALGDDVEAVDIQGDQSGWSIEIKSFDEFESGGNTQYSELTLVVPHGSDLDVAAVIGSLALSDLSSGRVDVENVSGSISLTNMDVDDLSVDNVSGRIQALGVSGRVNDYENVSGNVNVEDARGRIEIETVSGGISLQASEVSELECESVSGAMRLDVDVLPGASISLEALSGQVNLALGGTDAPRIQAETFSGRIETDWGNGVAEDSGMGQSLNLDGDGDGVNIEVESFSGRVEIRDKG